MDKNYKEYVDKISPKPTYVKNYILSFVVGGIICVIGQVINDVYMKFGLDKLKAANYLNLSFEYTHCTKNELME